MDTYGSRRNYSWAVFLVLVGILLLLNTTGVVGWGVWQYIVRFWPVFIVLIGIKIILGNSFLAKALEIFFTILLTVAVFGVAYIQYTAKGIDFLPKQVNDWILEGGSGVFNLTKDNVQSEISVSVDEYENIVERNLVLKMGAGSMNIVEDGEAKEYLHINQDHPRVYENSVLEQSEREGVLNLDFSTASPKNFNLFPTESTYDITLGQLGIPSTFDIEIGAGKGELDLQTLPVKDFYTKVGAGSFSATFSRYSIPTGDIYFNIGTGQMTLYIPERIGYVFEYDLGVGKINVEGQDISDFSTGRGKYTSSNYKDADIKLNMIVNVGVGTFTIKNN